MPTGENTGGGPAAAVEALVCSRSNAAEAELAIAYVRMQPCSSQGIAYAAQFIAAG